MVPEANVPMFSVVKLPEALVLVLAARADRVASVDWVVQDEAILRETAVPAVQVRPVLVHCLKLLLNPGTAIELEKANAVEPTQKFKAFNAALGTTVNMNLRLPLENNWIAPTV